MCACVTNTDGGNDIGGCHVCLSMPASSHRRLLLARCTLRYATKLQLYNNVQYYARKTCIYNLVSDEVLLQYADIAGLFKTTRPCLILKVINFSSLINSSFHFKFERSSDAKPSPQLPVRLPKKKISSFELWLRSSYRFEIIIRIFYNRTQFNVFSKTWLVSQHQISIASLGKYLDLQL